MNLWQQNYDPAGNIWLSSLIASLPILFFFFALIKLKLKGYVAASWTVAIALAVALLFYKMPVANALASVVYGFFYGLWPIAWIIIAAVFVYKISVKTGQFDIIRSSILSITPDQRLQMLIVGFCFGAFLEGAAGFGAPVAITAALLVGLGFKPLYAAGLCLIVNTAPVAFGAMGIPILEAGMKLPAERQLAMQLGVSRNSLREALAKLVSEGVLLSRRGGGTFIRWRHDTWSEQNIVQPLKTLMADDPDYSFDILEARYAIEASTAWHAAMCATPGDKEKIQLCFEATLSEDPDIASQADVRFHLAIAEASHNIVLLQTMRGFFDVLQSSVKHSRQRMYLVPPVFSQLTEQHQAVIDAIFAGDADGARKAMMAHLSFVHTTMKRFDEDQARHARITRLPGEHNEHSREKNA